MSKNFLEYWNIEVKFFVNKSIRFAFFFNIPLVMTGNNWKVVISGQVCHFRISAATECKLFEEKIKVSRKMAINLLNLYLDNITVITFQAGLEDGYLVQNLHGNVSHFCLL